MNKTKDAFYGIRFSYTGSSLVTAGSSPGKKKKVRRIHRSSATREDQSRRPKSPIEPSTANTERNRPFLFSVGNFWCKTDRLYRYPPKGQYFFTHPLPFEYGGGILLYTSVIIPLHSIPIHGRTQAYSTIHL